MKKEKMKRALALLCVGAMTVTGVNLPANVMSTEAAADWTWNALVSESGYRKVPVKELVAVADSVQTNNTEPNSGGEGAAFPGTGKVENIVDGVTSSFWHSNYSDNNQKVTFENGNLTGRNTLTISFKNNTNETIKGITYLPRQDALGNGAFSKLKIEVKQAGSEEWTTVTVNEKNPEIDYNNANKGNWHEEGRKIEKEILFDQAYNNVEKIKFTVTNSIGERPNEFLSGAEISVLKPHKEALEDKLTEIDALMGKYVLNGDESSGKVYDSTKYKPLKEKAEGLLAKGDATDQELKDILTQLESLEYKFVDERGTGKYLSDMSYVSESTGWNHVTKDQCPDNNGHLIAFKTGESDKTNTYTKGIGAHEPSTIVYDVTGYKKFTADAGIESHQSYTNKVNFIVSTSTDGSEFKEVQRVENVTVNGGLKKIDVDFEEGVTKMKLECKSAEGSSRTMHTCWANAKLYDSVAVTDITLDQESLDLKVGEVETLTPTITPDNSTDLEVVWESSNQKVATVENGKVTAVGIGTATVTVTSVSNPKVSAICIVNVTRNDEALDAVIAKAEAKMNEEDYDYKYTEDSRNALTEALDAAKAAKEDLSMSVEEVQLVIDELNAAIESLEEKFVVTINNNGTTETKYCEAGDQVTVVAKPAPEGQKFSHWTVNGTPISYKESYTFTVYGDTTVEAKYVAKEEVVEQEATIMCTSYYDVATSKVVFTAKRSLPAGCKVVQHGIIVTDSTGWNNLGEQGFVIGAQGTVKGAGKTTGLLGNYTCRMKSVLGDTWYGRGYVIYTDKNGETHTLYSNVTSSQATK